VMLDTVGNFRGNHRVMSEISLSRVMTWHFLEMAPNPGKPHLCSCRLRAPRGGGGVNR
jgi:hypothetical protein